MNKTTLRRRSDSSKKHRFYPFGNTRGQISLDFIAGVVIFMLTFIFLFQTLTNLFIPFQTNSDEIKSVSDRVTKTMVESTKGLASSLSGDNMISLNRAQSFHNDMNNTTSYRDIQNDVGLDNGDVLYDINMSLYNPDGSLYLDGTGEVVLNSGPKIPQSTNIAQTIRVVYVNQEEDIALLHVRVW